MRVFTKTTKVIGVTTIELSDLAGLVAEAKAKGRSETQVGPGQYLAIEVSEEFRPMTRERHPERR